jgi:hypothetical protein
MWLDIYEKTEKEWNRQLPFLFRSKHFLKALGKGKVCQLTEEG